MKDATPELQTPRWQAVFLVCRDCGKRSNGPKHLKPKALASLVRHETKRAKTRSRVLLTNCMGLCPKSAVAVAAAGSQATRIVAIKSAKQVQGAVSQLAADSSIDTRDAVA